MDKERPVTNVASAVAAAFGVVVLLGFLASDAV